MSEERETRTLVKKKEDHQNFFLIYPIFTVSQGGIANTVADPKLIFGCALKAAASGIILAHNHPSGSLQASHADIDLTKKLRYGGKLLDIQVLDPIIMTSESYYSFADEGPL